MRRVTICGVNTAQLKAIGGEEAKKLMKAAREGDTGARETLIRGNLKLVLSIVARFSQRGECLDDLFQVGCIGLMKAIDRFDLEQEVRFSTYAVPMIIGEIRRYLRDNTPLRVSRSTRDLAYRALSVRERLRSESGRDPTVEEIAKKMETSREEIAVAMDAIADPVSLFDPVGNDESDPLRVMDQIADPSDGTEAWIDGLAVRQAITCLSEREKKILALRFLAGKTQTEVAGQIGISQAQVSRLEKSALGQIREYL